MGCGSSSPKVLEPDVANAPAGRADHGAFRQPSFAVAVLAGAGYSFVHTPLCHVAALPVATPPDASMASVVPAAAAAPKSRLLPILRQLPSPVFAPPTLTVFRPPLTVKMKVPPEANEMEIAEFGMCFAVGSLPR